MAVTAVVGGHWGDEGKGKVVDALAARADMVIRYNGGNNAGHTIVGGQGVLRLHLVPSGIAHPAVDCLIGPGVVVNPIALLEELDALERAGISTARLRISTRAHLVFPFHIELDARMEEARGGRAHGTTRRGIWPVYADKAARVGVRAGDLLEPAFLRERLEEIAGRASAALGRTVDPEELEVQARAWAERLGPMIVDTHPIVREALRRNARIILEGHLGVMRDLDWGVYPYVTSSTCLAGGACAGAGIPPQRITRVIGVVKAYTTAVGAGPFPTELPHAVAELLRERGQEYGTSTRRPRRCGWFDGVAARFAAEVSGFTDLAVMKLDVLDGFETVKICVAYRDGGRVLETVPHTAVMERVEPVYEELPGWERTSDVRALEDLPDAARAFLERIEQVTGVPVSMVGVGREREALVPIPVVGGVV
ncbi:MAG: adenylosuccinate synthase [Armatimonadota bacterium]|nr:adenylosuccinate synthase [Armatimonadota bacterium]MDR7452474.1 adenylosuccinate synthase [Armatimonadota bacterium]MDR7467326.1 adenylosuccinate synthase [Armatimonadota bacterium]MDR7494097.1 adenylosuccinate synthase [Armatimonadota bacterium]MDR7498936.1 adenylosuccinate synthase [Armatimonadota bacterium]